MNLFHIHESLKEKYSDIFPKAVLGAIDHLLPLNDEIHKIIQDRDQNRLRRQKEREYIDFLAEEEVIPYANLKVKDIRKGNFVGSSIPVDLQRQWIQGTGPAARPNVNVEKNLRNVSYALLSGADGWMFDCEDALGQVGSMSLDHQRSLKMAIGRKPLFLEVAEKVATEMNAWSLRQLGRAIVPNWKEQLDFTTVICRARGLHLDDRHFRTLTGKPLSASLVDLALFVANNYTDLVDRGNSIVLYLPKIQTAVEAAIWNQLLNHLEQYLQLNSGTIKAYVLVEQLEATFQLMEIRACLGNHFVGFNTGRWDYINSVSDAMAWDRNFVNPNIEQITMTYGYMRSYENRVRQIVNQPDMEGNFALWQGGMEPNIPVGSEEGVSVAMEKAISGAVREQEAGASGKWVAHWKMVHLIRPVWEKYNSDNQMGRSFPKPRYDAEARRDLFLIEPGERTIRGARDLISIALQYGNAFLQGYQAAALKAADFFNNENVLYLMEDMATGEIRVSILWEWINKNAILTAPDKDLGLEKGSVFSPELFTRILSQEYGKLLNADNRDVHDDSKKTTLPISRAIIEKLVLSQVKLPWYIDLLNINLNNNDLVIARQRIELYIETFIKTGKRITENLDFEM